MRMTINKPFNVVGMEKKFNLKVNVNGSGLSAQADAVALGISRALIQFDPDLRPKLKKAGDTKKPKIKLPKLKKVNDEVIV